MVSEARHSRLNDRSARMQASQWGVNVADGCDLDSQGDSLSARFVTGSRVAGTDCEVVAVGVPAQNWYEISYSRQNIRSVI